MSSRSDPLSAQEFHSRISNESLNRLLAVLISHWHWLAMASCSRSGTIHWVNWAEAQVLSAPPILKIGWFQMPMETSMR